MHMSLFIACLLAAQAPAPAIRYETDATGRTFAVWPWGERIEYGGGRPARAPAGGRPAPYPARAPAYTAKQWQEEIDKDSSFETDANGQLFFVSPSGERVRYLEKPPDTKIPPRVFAALPPEDRLYLQKHSPQAVPRSISFDATVTTAQAPAAPQSAEELWRRAGLGPEWDRAGMREEIGVSGKRTLIWPDGTRIDYPLTFVPATRPNPGPPPAPNPAPPPAPPVAPSNLAAATRAYLDDWAAGFYQLAADVRSGAVPTVEAYVARATAARKVASKELADAMNAILADAANPDGSIRDREAAAKAAEQIGAALRGTPAVPPAARRAVRSPSRMATSVSPF